MSEPERRPKDRAHDELRPVSFLTGIQKAAAGSVLISTGQTRVICAASVEERVPSWMRDQPGGWVTAEYSMLPGSSDQRIPRRQSSRATEIQRLIGRSLRSVVDLGELPGLTITLDCDVLEADGGTRTASITGAWVALYLACQRLLDAGVIRSMPISGHLSAVSVGIVSDTLLLDLDYLEDSQAQVDLNVVGSERGLLVEVQGTAEGAPFSRQDLSALLDLAQNGMAQLIKQQRQALGLTAWITPS